MKAETTYNAILGRVIARRRGEVGVSRERICERLGVSISTWSRIERGDAAGISIEQLTRIAEALETTPGRIFAEADETQKALEDRGMTVHKEPAKKVSKAATAGVALVGLAALTGLVMAAMKKDGDGGDSE